jgi:hypothetical protein
MNIRIVKVFVLVFKGTNAGFLLICSNQKIKL